MYYVTNHFLPFYAKVIANRAIQTIHGGFPTACFLTCFWSGWIASSLLRIRSVHYWYWLILDIYISHDLNRVVIKYTVQCRAGKAVSPWHDSWPHITGMQVPIARPFPLLTPKQTFTFHHRYILSVCVSHPETYYLNCDGLQGWGTQVLYQ